MEADRAFGAGRRTRMFVGGLGENSVAVYVAGAGQRYHLVCCFVTLEAMIRSNVPSTRIAEWFTHGQVLESLPARPGKPLSFGMLVATSGFVPHGAPEQ